LLKINGSRPVDDKQSQSARGDKSIYWIYETRPWAQIQCPEIKRNSRWIWGQV